MDYPSKPYDPCTGPLTGPLPGDQLPAIRPTVTRAVSRTDAPAASTPTPKLARMIGTPPIPRNAGGNGYPANRVPRPKRK